MIIIINLYKTKKSCVAKKKYFINLTEGKYVRLKNKSLKINAKILFLPMNFYFCDIKRILIFL